MTSSTPTAAPAAPDASETLPQQYSIPKTLAVWALAAIPMAIAAWVLGPAIADRHDDANGLLRGLLVALTVALVWQFLVVVFLVRREAGTLRWSVVRPALWLDAPRSPKTGVRGGRVWWMLIPLVILLAVLQAIPTLPGFDERRLDLVLQTDDAKEFFAGNWGWFALVVVMLVFNTVVGEELLFRGLLLPRMQTAFGRAAWVWNGVLFALYHVHQPWTMPNVLLSSVVFAGGTQRYRSAWIGIITHSMQTVIVTGLVLSLVLA